MKKESRDDSDDDLDDGDYEFCNDFWETVTHA